MKITCSDCSNPPLPDCRRCAVCRKTHNERERLRRAERKRKKLCWACGTKALKGKSACAAHEGHGWRQAS